MFTSLLLCTAVCADIFLASFTYGVRKIKIPVISSLIISIMGSAFLYISLKASALISSFISVNSCTILCSLLLFLIGTYSIFQDTVKTHLAKRQKSGKRLTLKLFGILDTGFFIDIYVDETAADKDNSNLLSAKEAFALAVPLSLDALATGLAAGLIASSPEITAILSLVIGLFSIAIGFILGKLIGNKINRDMSWISGGLLIALAVICLLQ